MIKAEKGKLKAVEYFGVGGQYYSRQDDADSIRLYLNDQGDVIAVRNKQMVLGLNGHSIESLTVVEEDAS